MESKTTKIDPARAILWASAFLLTALVVIQAGKLPGNPAYAGSVSNREGYTLLMVDSGRGEDAAPDEVLCVIDNRAEVMIVYEIDVRTKTIVSRDGGLLPPIFRNVVNR